MKKFLCMLAALLCAAMLPLTGLAAIFEASIGTTINHGVRYVNEITDFAIILSLEEKNLREETEVRIYFDDPSVVETLELFDEDNARWVPLSVENGYYCIPRDPYDWKDYFLRIVFKKSGEHQYEVGLVYGNEGYFIAKSTGVVTVSYPAQLTTDIATKKFVRGVSTEFSFTTTANDDKDKLVVGNASFSDPSAIEKLEYYEPRDGQWYPLEGNFGPAQGFPLSDATSKFRVTFNRAGEYSFTAQLVDVANDEEVCNTTASFKVTLGPAVLLTSIDGMTVEVGVPTEFVFITVPNDDRSRMVVGNATFSDPSAIEKLEYYESSNSQWYPLEGNFGPEQGFPLSFAMSRFRVTFKKAGEYSFTAQLVDAKDGSRVCAVDASLCVEGGSAVPETGDNSHLMLWAALAMVSLLGVTMIIRRKENA